MEGFRVQGRDTQSQWSLTQLYSDAKQSYLEALPSNEADPSPDLKGLYDQFYYEKDRLIAWGLDWAGEGGNIDRSVEDAGLTDLVSSVMERIKDILDQVEQIRLRSVQAPPPSAYLQEKSRQLDVHQMNNDDKEQFRQLVNELTGGIDLLCDVSKPRDHTTSKSGKAEKGRVYDAPQIPSLPDRIRDTTYSGFRELVKMEASSLSLPEEGPPPYDSFGMPCPARFIGHLRQPATSTRTEKPTVSEPTAVFIEYAPYDGVYKHTGVPLPLARLEHVHQVLEASRNSTNQSLMRLIGFFEDAHQPRYGLVYQLPTITDPTGIPMEPPTLSRPKSLLSLVQNASRLHSNPTASSSLMMPALEARFRLALELTSALDFLRSHGLSHREINSNSILFFSKSLASYSNPSSNSSFSSKAMYNVRRPVICSFDAFSEYNIESTPEVLHQNIYRHPEDPRVKGPNAAEEYRMEFDLYSLGLVLLEIGLWAPLAEVFKEKYSLQDFKTRVEKIWTKRLASKCGTTFMRAVQDCLGMGQISPRPDDSLHVVYSRVLKRLQRCCMLEDEDGMDQHLEAEGQSLVGETISAEPPIMHEGRGESFSSVQGARQPSVVSSPVGIGEEIKMFPTNTPSNYDSKISHEFVSRNETRSRSKRLRFPNKTMPDHIQAQGLIMEERLAHLVSKILRRLQTKESVSVSLIYTGESEESAKPTFEIGCTSTRVIRANVAKKFQFDKDIFDLVIVKDKILRSKSSRKRTRSIARSGASTTNNSGKVAVNQDFYERPVCGASIGAWKDCEHLPPTSFGGVVLIDGQPFGMSVHHLLEDPGDGVGQPDHPRRSGNYQAHASGGSDTRLTFESLHEGSPFDAYQDSDEEDAASITIETDFSDEENELSDLEFSDDEGYDDLEDGDTEGIMMGEGEEIVITQPALDDVKDDFFPCEEDKDEDHLDSHTLGHIHASSGIRRSTVDGIEHEVDWALIKLKDDRLQPYNLIAGGKRHCQLKDDFFVPPLREPVCRQKFEEKEDLYPRKVARSDQLGNLRVHCLGRTSGLETGQISTKMEFVCFPGRVTPSKSWTVTGNFGTGGDSGAWVIDNEQGRICGHVLGWSRKRNVTYIAPMDMLFEDMRRTLGARHVTLPGGDASRMFSLGANSEGAEAVDLSSPEMTSSTSRRLAAQHMLFTGSPGHMEREWSARRTALGQTALG